MKIFKKFLPHLMALVVFIAVLFAFVPKAFEGKVLNQSDGTSFQSAFEESRAYNEATGDHALWTNSMFSGMPTTTLGLDRHTNYIRPIFKQIFIFPSPAGELFFGMVGFYLLILLLGGNLWMRIAGALIFAFCSYNFQIIVAGHNTKFVAMMVIPWVMTALIFAYKKNSLLGASLFGIALAIELLANHPQITYYLAFMVIFYALSQLYVDIKAKRIKHFIITSLLLVFSSALAGGSNASGLLPTWDYAKHTMRGGSELAEAKNDGRTGLDFDYATEWSYGIGESLNLFIPDFKGGSSVGKLGKNSETYKLIAGQAGDGQATEITQRMPLYWGNQMFTSGPMYMGAVAIFLFVLGLILIKGPMKWWVAGLTILVLFVGWGRNFGFFNLFYNYVPLFNKFRVPSMIMILLQTTIPLLGIYCLSKIYKGEIDKNISLKGLKIATIICGGICLLFALIPGISGDFTATGDASLPDWLKQTLPTDRKSLLRMDAMRSLLFVLLTSGAIWAMLKNKIQAKYIMPAITLLILIDMWGVDKRYISNDNFISKVEHKNNFTPRPVDNQILKDKELDYRVLDLTVNPFNDSYSSFFHKCIGGYSPAKLQRYQDLIEHNISHELQVIAKNAQNTREDSLYTLFSNTPVLNMLNLKYLILTEKDAIVNTYAQGNAWFANNYVITNNTVEEIGKLSNTDLTKTAIIGDDFKSNVNGLNLKADSTASIRMEKYSPNSLTYTYQTNSPQLCIMSEVFYPDWIAEVDGKEIQVFRADYILRACVVPEGKHTLTLNFRPKAIIKGHAISAYSSSILLLMLLASVLYTARINRNKRKE